jgi:hypothetical protein
VTDCAYRTIGIAELLSVATGTWRMLGFSWQGRTRGIILPSMTEQAWQTRMLLIIVFEL